MNMSFTGERYVPELRGQIYYEHFHRYAMVLELARDADVLDIACGEGYGTAALALVAKSAVGVDNDPTAIHHGASRYTAMNVDFRLGDCTQIPAANASFDLVVSFETLEHLAEHERMLSEVRRVLRPNGRLVISSPNKLVYSDARSAQNPFHVRELYFHEFRDVLRAFFPVVKIFGQRIFAASAVHPLRGSAEETRWLGPSTIAETSMGALPDPEYFIAICGVDAAPELPDLCSVYVDPRDELLADIRSGGLATALNGNGNGNGNGPVALSSVDHEALPAPVVITMTDETAKYRDQAQKLEAHALGLQSLLDAATANLDREHEAHAELAAGFERDARETHDTLIAECARVAELAARIEHNERASDELLKIERARSAELVARIEQNALDLKGEREAHTAQVAQADQVSDELLALERARGVELVSRIEDLSLEAKAERESHTVELGERDRQLEVAADQARALRNQVLAANERLSEQETRLSDQTARLEEALQREHDTARSAAEELLGAHARVDDLINEQRRLTEANRLLGEAEATALSETAAARREVERLLRQVAGLQLECESLRDGSEEVQSRHARELRALETELLGDRGKVDFELLAARQEVARRTNEAAELRAKIARLESLLEKGELVRRNAEQQLASRQLERLSLEEANARAAAAETLLADITGSRSWQMTLPARRLMGVVRARRKH